MTTYKLYGGNIGILVNGRILSKTNQGCPRRIALRNAGIQEPIDERAEITFAIGKALEGVFAKINPTYKMNVRLNEMPQITEKVCYGVECDAYDPNGQVVYELKSVSSTKMLKSVFVHREYKLDNLIQLAQYMMVFDSEEMPIQKGILRYTNTVYDSFTVAKKEHKFAAGDIAEFHAVWNGNVLVVDGKPSPVTQSAIVAFLEYAAWVLESRPKVTDIVKPLDEEGECIACRWCHWREYCEAAEARGYTLDEFIESIIPF